MADNWLEKKQAALSGGPTVIRKVNPSVEQLLRRVAEDSMIDPLEQGDSSSDPLSTVKQAQLDAIIRAAKLLYPGMEFGCEEGSPAHIEILTQVNGPTSGKAVLAMQMKAAELGLKALESGPVLLISKLQH